MRFSNAQIEKARRRHDWNARYTRFETTSALSEKTHYSIGGGQTERTSSAQHYGIRVHHQRPRSAQISFPRSRRRAI